MLQIQFQTVTPNECNNYTTDSVQTQIRNIPQHSVELKVFVPGPFAEREKNTAVWCADTNKSNLNNLKIDM